MNIFNYEKQSLASFLKFKGILAFTFYIISITANAQEIEPAQKEIEEDVVVYLERTACYGTCPVFNFKIFEDGRASYEGIENVDKVGFYEAEVSQEKLEEVVQLFLDADFFEYKDKYTSLITDMPTTYIYLSHEGRQKKIIDYYDAPKRLKLLEKEVIDFMKNLCWTKLEKEEEKDIE